MYVCMYVCIHMRMLLHGRYLGVLAGKQVYKWDNKQKVYMYVCMYVFKTGIPFIY